MVPGAFGGDTAGVAIVEQGPGVARYDFPIPAPQKERKIEGFVCRPDGRPAEKVGILLEDVRWPWQASVIAATTDSKGHFEIFAFDRTAYRVHAVTMAHFTDEAVSAEPIPLGSGTDLNKPLRLMLTRKGNSAAELVGKGLERWKAGLGFWRRNRSGIGRTGRAGREQVRMTTSTRDWPHSRGWPPCRVVRLAFGLSRT